MAKPEGWPVKERDEGWVSKMLTNLCNVKRYQGKGSVMSDKTTHACPFWLIQCNVGSFQDLLKAGDGEHNIQLPNKEL